MDFYALKQDDEVFNALAAADALGKASNSSKLETDGLTDALKELDMDNYDEEDDGVELFGSGLGNLYYPNNDMDPYLKNQNDDDSEEEEDITINPEDAVIICARNEDDVSHLEVWIIEDPTAGDINMYVHHDIVIPTFPLCTAWLDCPIKGGEKAIEIWDLDIMDAVQPSAVLGGVIEMKKAKKVTTIATREEASGFGHAAVALFLITFMIPDPVDRPPGSPDSSGSHQLVICFPTLYKNLLNIKLAVIPIQFLDLLGTRSTGFRSF